MALYILSGSVNPLIWYDIVFQLMIPGHPGPFFTPAAPVQPSVAGNALLTVPWMKTGSVMGTLGK